MTLIQCSCEGSKVWQEVKAARDAESDMESVVSEPVEAEEEEEEQEDRTAEEKDEDANQVLETVMKVKKLLFLNDS